MDANQNCKGSALNNLFSTYQGIPMLTKIDIRDRILNDWQHNGANLSYLQGQKVRHHFYEMGVIDDYCHNCGRVRVEFDSEDLSISIGVFEFLWEGTDFSFDLIALRKIYQQTISARALADINNTHTKQQEALSSNG
jgi:hypothetical protein